MRHFYWALAKITRFELNGTEVEKRPSYWRAWVLGVSLLDGITRWLLCAWLTHLSRLPIPGAIAATVVVCFWEHFLRQGKFPQASLVIANLLHPLPPQSTPIAQQQQAAINLALLLLKPALVFLVCLSGGAFWMVPTALLSTCIYLDMTGGATTRRATSHSLKAVCHWLGSLILFGAFSLCWHNSRMAIVSFAALIIAYLLPNALVSHLPFAKDDKQPLAQSVYLFLGETAMLAVGLLGLAL